jgi:hypothetical protein
MERNPPCKSTRSAIPYFPQLSAAKKPQNYGATRTFDLILIIRVDNEQKFLISDLINT